MKAEIKIETGRDCKGGAYSVKHKGMPGLLWAEIVKVADEYSKFEKGKKGTRFDTWL